MKKVNPQKIKAKSLFIIGNQSLPKIARELDIPIGTLCRWAHEGKWTSIRDSQESAEAIVPLPPPPTELPPNPTDETIAKWQELEDLHSKAYGEIRQLATFHLKTITKMVARFQVAKDTNALESIALSLPVAKATAEWTKALDLAIKGERLVSSAQYFDLNKAIALVRFYGFEVTSTPLIEEKSAPIEVLGISADTSDRILREALGVLN